LVKFSYKKDQKIWWFCFF